MFKRWLPLFMFAALGVALAAPQAFAYSYGTAGCGLGEMAFHDQPGKIQIVAATLNNISSLQTSAITSGTSGCYDNANKMASMYMTINKVALEKDISRGNGETLAGLAKIYGCSNSAQLGKVLKSNFSEIYQNVNTTAKETSDRIQTVIQSNKTLVSSCRALS